MSLKRSVRLGLLAGVAIVAPGIGAVQAQTAHIPLRYVVDGNSSLRLSIMVGIGSEAPKPYLFDTGSPSFNLANQSAWVPPPTSTLATNVLYTYGAGTIGYLVDQVTYPSLSFYTSGGVLAHTLTASGAPFQVGIGEFVTIDPSLGVGPPVTIGGQVYYENAAWAAALQAGTPPEYGTFYGTFGAGDFVTGTNVPGLVAGSVLGQATTSGYVVAANGPAAPSAQLPCSPCVTLGLTPEVRAQFTTLVPWYQSGPSFPVSGANGGLEHNSFFTYTLSAPGLTTVTWTSATLLDSGTPFYQIHTSANIAAFLTGTSVTPGVTMTVAGTVAETQTTTIVAQAFPAPETNWILEGTDSTLGIGFFQLHSVMYDLENRLTGYTSSFVTDTPITTPFDVGPELGPIGMAGVISGADGVKVESGGVLTLSAGNTYAGKTAVMAGGALAIAGPGSISRSSEVRVDGTLDISRVTAGTDITTLSGSGTVALGNQSLTITAGATDFSGSLQDGGQINFVGGNVIIAGGFQSFSGTNTYTGGTAVKSGAGLGLSGSLEGMLVNDGSVISSGTLNGSVVNRGLFVNNGTVNGPVNNLGLLRGNGTVNGLLNVSGVVSPGNSIGTFHVNGVVTFLPGSLYAAELGAPGHSDLIAVTGSATIAGGVLLLAPGAGFAPTLGAQYQILTATTGILGAFALDPAYMGAAGSVLPFLGARLDPQSTALDLTLVRSAVPFTALATTPNAHAAATGAGGVALDTPLGAALVGLPGAQAEAAFNALSGEAYASTGTLIQQQAIYVRDAVGSRLMQSLTAPGVSPLAYGAGPQTAALGEGLTPTLWAQGYGGWGNSFSNGNAASISNSIGGFLIGADVALAPNVRAGLFGGFSQSQFDVADRSSTGSMNNVDLGLYAGAQFGAFAVRGGASYTWHDVSTNRTVAFPGFSQAVEGGYNTGTTQVFGELGYDFAVGAYAFEPFAGLAYVNVAGASLQESGGSAGLSVSTSGMSTTYSTLGLRVATTLQAWGSTLTPHATVGWQHAFGDTTPTSTMQFLGGAMPFSVSGVPIAEDAVLLQAGLTYALSPKATLGASYTSQLASTAAQNAFTAQFSLKF